MACEFQHTLPKYASRLLLGSLGTEALCRIENGGLLDVYVQTSVRYTRGIQKVRAILECFRCVIGNTAEAWSYCSSRSDSDMLRVWFSCPFVRNECGVKMVTIQEDSTKDKQR
jgi:hypothetical protein